MASAALTGTLLGGVYRVGKLLGEGGMGAVYEGTQEGLNRKVAIKVLKAQGQLSEATLTRFAREARATAELGHPNIVQVTDFQWQKGEPPFLVMERLVGHSLRDLIRAEQRLPPVRVAFIATQVLDALSVAHRAGIVHRDIKPDNVFLTRMSSIDDIVKLLDFGVAKLVAEGSFTAHGARMGSPAYMSPEQAGGRTVDARTDLFCLGSTLYHALTGRLPFDAPNLAELLAWIESRPAPPLAPQLPGVDPRMCAVVDRAMAKDPAHRFQTADEMKQALEPLQKARESWAGSAPTDFASTDRVSHLPSQVPALTSSGPLGRPMPVGVASLASAPLGAPAAPPLSNAAPPNMAPAPSPFSYTAQPASIPAHGAAPFPHAPPPQGVYGPPPGLPLVPSPYGPPPALSPAYGPYPGSTPLATEGASAWKIAGWIALWKLKILLVLGLGAMVVGAIVAYLFR
jgi:serine/threonine-protein kinase